MKKFRRTLHLFVNEQNLLKLECWLTKDWGQILHLFPRNKIVIEEAMKKFWRMLNLFVIGRKRLKVKWPLMKQMQWQSERNLKPWNRQSRMDSSSWVGGFKPYETIHITVPGLSPISEGIIS
jgi:hypothetical protein